MGGEGGERKGEGEGGRRREGGEGMTEMGYLVLVLVLKYIF